MAADCFVPDRVATRLCFSRAFLDCSRDDIADFAALRFVAGLGIGISFGSAQPSGCTTEAPQKRLSRRGGIPERQTRSRSQAQ
jgi:hypothetical protein